MVFFRLFVVVPFYRYIVFVKDIRFEMIILYFGTFFWQDFLRFVITRFLDLYFQEGFLLTPDRQKKLIEVNRLTDINLKKRLRKISIYRNVRGQSLYFT